MSAAPKPPPRTAAIKQSGYADQYGAATENLDEACSLASTIKAFFLAPVLGGVKWRALYQACALGIFVFFCYTVAAVAPSWTEKVTAATTEFQESYALPDIYACLSAANVADFIQAQASSDTMLSGKTFANGGAKLRFKSGVTSDGDRYCGAYAMSVYDLATRKPINSCPVAALGVSDNWISMGADGVTPTWGDGTLGNFKDRVAFHGFEPDAGADYTAPTDVFLADVVAGNLARTLPHVNHTNPITSVVERVEAVCFHHKMRKEALSLYTNASSALLGFQARMEPVAAVEENVPVWEFYITEQNVAPYDTYNGARRVNASTVFMSGAMATTKTDLLPTKFKDETAPFNDKTWRWQYTSTNLFQRLNELTIKQDAGYDSSVGAEFLFAFNHFTRQVHIRNKTFAEIWAELGGLWAAAALLMGFFFVQSGATTADDKPAYVFAYLPNSVRRRYIREAQGDAAPRSAPMKAVGVDAASAV